jgi:hypothetical protein
VKAKAGYEQKFEINKKYHTEYLWCETSNGSHAPPPLPFSSWVIDSVPTLEEAEVSITLS